jgi:nucleotide-binding universal stress UspA family protein
MSKILLAVDDSPGTWKAVNYVEDWLSREEIAVHIFHALEPVPPALREFPGSENPHEETILEAQLKQKQKAWREKAKKAAEPVIKEIRLILEQAGAMPDQISSHCSALMHREDLPDEILKAARESGCDAIVVGRNCFPWVKEVFTDHLDEELKKKIRRNFRCSN